MITVRFIPAAIAAILLLCFTGVMAAPAPLVPAETEELLDRYCYRCHDEDTQKGDIRLDNCAELERPKRLELFNRMHELETELTDEQLRAILLKNDSWLMYILQISMGNFHK